MSEIKNNLQFKDDKLHLEDEVVMKKVSGIPVNQEDETGTIDVDANINIGGFTSINGNAKILGSMEVSGVSYKVIENPERLSVTTDSEGRILGGRKTDGIKFENVGFETPKLDIDGNSTSGYKDDYDRIELKLDNEERIVNYRSKDGVLHEEAGVSTPSLLDIKTINNVKAESVLSSFGYTPREYNLPKYGYVDIKKELSFTDGTDNYAPTKISKVGSQYYVTETLVDGQVGPDSVEVTLVESDIDITQWPIYKKAKHYCKVEIDFGNYLSGTFYIEVKYQGATSLLNPDYLKKNFRFTFYKDVLFSKKQSQKIGELIKTKKYNLKAYWIDTSLLREQTIYRIIQAVKETRTYNNQYPWNKFYNVVTGATGLTNGFPCRVNISGNFYGIHWFGLAKDIANFMLSDDDMNGILIQGDDPGNENPTFWTVLDTNCWEDLLADIEHAIGEDSIVSVEDLYHYINSENGYSFNKDTAYQHLNIQEWIDAIIILQTFCCVDSLAKNMILYSDEDKQVFSPMFYDLDWTWTYTNPGSDVFNVAQAQDRSVWINFKALFWKEICERYNELRTSVLNFSYIQTLMINVSRNIDYSDYEEEINKWGNHGSGTLKEHLDWIKERFVWLDSYFKN